jgi:hypothetical protein
MSSLTQKPGIKDRIPFVENLDQIAGDALYDAANSNGLLEKFGADTVQHISGNGLNGRASLFKPAPWPEIPPRVNGAGNRTSEKRRCDRAASVSGENNPAAQGSPGELRYAGD